MRQVNKDIKWMATSVLISALQHIKRQTCSADRLCNGERSNIADGFYSILAAYIHLSLGQSKLSYVVRSSIIAQYLWPL